MNTDVIPATGAVVARSTSVFDGNVQEFKGALARRGENRKALIDWVRGSLVDGTDFGRIHSKKKSECQHRGPPGCTPDKEPYHWSKNTLFKPGAEKICGMLGVTPTFPTMKDYEQSALNGVPIESIILRCHLLSAEGGVVAEGTGARNVAQDYGNLNTALKMASKSAHIDATLRMAGLSEIFTQDLDDIHPPTDSTPEQTKTPAAQSQRTETSQQQKSAKQDFVPHTESHAPGNQRGMATEKQIKLIQYRADMAQIPMLELLENFGIREIRGIPFNRVNEILAFLGERGE
jgi:hypothetical protein